MTIKSTSNLAARALLLLAALGTAYLLLTDGLRHRSARCRYDDAMEAIQYEEPIRALQLLQEAVRLDPDCAEYHASLALAYSTDRYSAAEFLGLSLPDLYAKTLHEAATASALRPDDLELAKSYAYWSLDAGLFEAAIDWGAAHGAWANYLDVHRRNWDRQPTNPGNHLILTYGILVRLSRIETEQGNLEAADAFMREALSLEIQDPVFIRSSYVQEYLRDREPRLSARNAEASH